MFELLEQPSSPYINHFLSADTIVPGYANPQNLNRYSYVTNNPLRYTDPSGHREVQGCGTDGKSACIETDPIKKAKDAQKLAKLKHKAEERLCRNGDYAYCSGVQGGQVQFTVAVGGDTQLKNIAGQNVDPLLFYGVSIVFDKHIGVQVFRIRRDIQFNPYYSPGPAEIAYPMSFGGAGGTIGIGVIRGTQFAANGTEAFGGDAVDWTIGGGPLSVDHYEDFDGTTGFANPTTVSGDDISYSFGFPVSFGQLAIYAEPWTSRIGLPIKDPYE